MSLPEVQEVIRWHFEPGDKLILRTSQREVSMDDAEKLREIARHALNLPPDAPVLIVTGEWNVSVISKNAPDEP